MVEQSGRVYLDVPFAEKDQAKRLGARWDQGARRWFDPRPPTAGLQRWAALPEVPDAVKAMLPEPAQTPQNMKEYDPEWARAFVDGTVALNSPHDVMLSQAKTPVLLTHHMRAVVPTTDIVFGALTDAQAMRPKQLIESAGQRCDYQDHPTAMHMMHQFDPELFTKVVVEWAATLS